MVEPVWTRVAKVIGVLTPILASVAKMEAILLTMMVQLLILNERGKDYQP